MLGSSCIPMMKARTNITPIVTSASSLKIWSLVVLLDIVVEGSLREYGICSDMFKGKGKLWSVFTALITPSQLNSNRHMANLQTIATEAARYTWHDYTEIYSFYHHFLEHTYNYYRAHVQLLQSAKEVLQITATHPNRPQYNY